MKFLTIFVLLMSAYNGLAQDESAETIITYDFQVQVREKGSHLCSGLIVNGKTVLTAAKCVYKKLADQLSVAQIDFSSEKLYPISEIIFHPQFKLNLMKNDLALLILKEPFQSPLQITDFDVQEFTGKHEVDLLGWGATDSMGITTSEDLMKVTVETVTNEECQELWAQQNVTIFPNQICTFLDPKGACDGDNGGPVVSKKGKVIGIISFSPKPCGTVYPDVHTRIQPYLKWIKENAVSA